ncbi:MAG: flagellar biosynthetic protein FliO [Terracidiphilus sp.]|jgi:flagellar biogenesis protein FliO
MKLERGQGRIGSPVIELARWLFKRLQPSPARPAQMAVLERISLAPRQSLTLVEVQECKFLIVTSVEGISVVHPLGTGRIPCESWLPLLPASNPTESTAAETGTC